jgi:hypothetical protein
LILACRPFSATSFSYRTQLQLSILRNRLAILNTNAETAALKASTAEIEASTSASNSATNTPHPRNSKASKKKNFSPTPPEELEPASVPTSLTGPDRHPRRMVVCNEATRPSMLAQSLAREGGEPGRMEMSREGAERVASTAAALQAAARKMVAQQEEQKRQQQQQQQQQQSPEPSQAQVQPKPKRPDVVESAEPPEERDERPSGGGGKKKTGKKKKRSALANAANPHHMKNCPSFLPSHLPLFSFFPS